jgi:hypothetical protein
VATEAAWLNGDNLEKEEINEAEREKKRKDERKVLTLTGLLMELDPTLKQLKHGHRPCHSI